MMNVKFTAFLFSTIIIALVVISIIYHPAKIVHPDSLRFMALFQQKYATVGSAADIPRAIYDGIADANRYDWYRGRITNYIAFGVDALIRGAIPFPFISWLTMGLLILNAALLARLVTKDITSVADRNLLFGLAALVLLMNPLFIAGYEMQFIYSKYLCVTFMLLFQLAQRPGTRILALAGAMFSDEIGVAFSMLAAFLAMFNYKFKTASIERTGLWSALQPLAYGVVSAFAVLALYYATLLLAFHQVSTVILKGGFHNGYKFPPSLLEFSADLLGSALAALGNSALYLKNLLNLALGDVGVVMLLLAACMWIYRNVRELGRHLSLEGVRATLARLMLGDKKAQEITAAVIFAGFITWAMYRGTAGLFYYGYPVYMLIMFVVFSVLIKKGSHRPAPVALTVLVLSMMLRLPYGFEQIRNEATGVWISDKSVTAQRFADVELIVNEVRQRGCTSRFDEIIKTQDNVFSGSGNTYGAHYFPIQGIANVLAWPHKVARCF